MDQTAANLEAKQDGAQPAETVKEQASLNLEELQKELARLKDENVKLQKEAAERRVKNKELITEVEKAKSVEQRLAEIEKLLEQERKEKDEAKKFAAVLPHVNSDAKRAKAALKLATSEHFREDGTFDAEKFFAEHDYLKPSTEKPAPISGVNQIGNTFDPSRLNKMSEEELLNFWRKRT